MNIDKAIKVLKDAKYIGKFVSDYDKRMNEAIDTVVAEVEKFLPTDEEIIEMSNEYARKHTEPEAWYVLNRRFGFQNGATWMRDLIQERIKK